MIVSIIAAIDRCNAIGKSNLLPWHLPLDLKRFKKITMGHHMIMGRKTWMSIGRPLPGRNSIVLTRNKQLQIEGCVVVNTLQEALDYAKNQIETEVFIIGGGEIFHLSINIAEKIYLTLIEAEMEADTYFPEIKSEDWQEVEHTYFPADKQHQYAHHFKILIRR